jgi:hypothetical protein
LFDQAVTARESRARHKLTDQLAERAKHGEDKLALAEEILPVPAGPAIPDEQVGDLLPERIGMTRLRAALATPAIGRRPRGHGHLALIDASYGYLRQFTPEMLRVLSFAGGLSATELLDAVDVLGGFDATGTRSVPVDAPTRFVPARWRGYLDDALTAGATAAYRHYWELCVLLCLLSRRAQVATYGRRVPGKRGPSLASSSRLSTPTATAGTRRSTPPRCRR